MTTVEGRVSWFGGPNDMGVDPDEGLAFIYDVEDAPHLFLSYQPEDTTGLARRLNPRALYVACRWNYDEPGMSKEDLLEEMALVRNVRTGRALKAYPADWGPHEEDTGRVADISPGLMTLLELETDDIVEVIYPFTSRRRWREEPPPPPPPGKLPYERIVISSGHGLLVRGASGVLDEVDEARTIVDEVVIRLCAMGVDAIGFHDDESTNQSENLETIVDFHNAQERALDVSIHFNAYVETSSPMGCEVLYVTQEDLAADMSATIASVGFQDRGPKKRMDLYFLNQTTMPSILIETCFVDSEADADIYNERINSLCDAIVAVLTGRPL